MNAKAYVAMVVTAMIVALVVSILLKAIGLPKGDLHPMITGALATVGAMIVFQKMKAGEGSEASPSE